MAQLIREPKSRARPPRTSTPMRAALLFVLAGAATACQAYPTVKKAPIDCSPDDRYDLSIVDPFETITAANTAFWNAGDALVMTGDLNESIEPISGDGRCGSKAALVLRSVHANDWGSIFGYNNFGPRDASGTEGMAFWARAPGATTKAFTISLDDANTAPDAKRCVDYGTDGGTAAPSGPTTDGLGNVISTGASVVQPQPDACSNSYTAVVVVTTEWSLYTVPWERFTQVAAPNRVPNAVFTEVGPVPGTGLLIDKIWTFILRMPKEATMELWLDNLAFYRTRTKGSAAGADAGAD
jgi:hypothetical protein